MLNTVNSRTNIPFESLKSNLRLGETVLREFRQEFPSLHSNSFWDIKIADRIRISGLNEKLTKADKVALRYSNDLDANRKHMKKFDRLFYSEPDVYIGELKQLLRQNKAANCAEHAEIVRFSLMQKGEKPQNIAIRILDKESEKRIPGKNHVFTVFGLKKYARWVNPNSWGTEAVVVDAWGSVVMQSREAIEYFKQKLGHNSDKHTVEFVSTC